MEFGFFFKLGIAFVIAGGMGYVISKYELKDPHASAWIPMVSTVAALLCFVFGIDINPDQRDYYWDWYTARIADGLCIAQETEVRSPGLDQYDEPRKEQLLTRYVCPETEFWREPK